MIVSCPGFTDLKIKDLFCLFKTIVALNKRLKERRRERWRGEGREAQRDRGREGGREGGREARKSRGRKSMNG